MPSRRRDVEARDASEKSKNKRMDSAKECLEEVGRGRDAGPPAGCGQAQPTLGTSESDRGVYLVILLVYLQQKKEEGLHQFSTPDVLSGGPPSWDLEHRGLCFGCDLFINLQPHDLGKGGLERKFNSRVAPMQTRHRVF